MIRELYYKIRKIPLTDKELTESTIKKIRENGGIVGDNVDIYASSFDLGEPYLIHIGSNVTIVATKILTHDASTKKFTGYTKAGYVHIGDNVFIGYGCIILPKTKIGNNVIIGAGTVVAHDIPDNSVVCGNPVRRICSFDEYIEKNKVDMIKYPVIDMLPREILNNEKNKRLLIDSGYGFIL